MKKLIVESKSYVYVVRDPSRPSLLKIGKSNNPQARITRLEEHAGSPDPWVIEGVLECRSETEALEIEKATHKHFNNFNYKKEWFKSLNPVVVKQYWKENYQLHLQLDEMGVIDPTLSTRQIPLPAVKHSNLIAQDWAYICENYLRLFVPDEWSILTAISNVTKHDSIAKISHDKIAEFTGLSRRTVQRKIKTLIDNGWVEKYSDSLCASNTYLFTSKFTNRRPTNRIPANYNDRVASLMNSLTIKVIDSGILGGTLSPSDFVVLTCIIRYVLWQTRGGQEGCPVSKLCELSGLSKPTVRESRDKLCRLNYVTSYQPVTSKAPGYHLTDKLLNL